MTQIRAISSRERPGISTRLLGPKAVVFGTLKKTSSVVAVKCIYWYCVCARVRVRPYTMLRYVCARVFVGISVVERTPERRQKLSVTIWDHNCVTMYRPL